MNKKRGNYIKLYYFILFLTIFISIATILLWRVYFQGLETEKWLVTKGKILKSSIETLRYNKSLGSSSSDSKSYRLLIEYEYVIENKVYHNNNLSYKSQKNNKEYILNKKSQ